MADVSLYITTFDDTMTGVGLLRFCFFLFIPKYFFFLQAHIPDLIPTLSKGSIFSRLFRSSSCVSGGEAAYRSGKLLGIRDLKSDEHLQKTKWGGSFFYEG